MLDPKVPDSTEEILSEDPTTETVSSTPNSGILRDAAPVVDGPGFEAGEDGTGHWEGNGQDVKFVSEK